VPRPPPARQGDADRGSGGGEADRNAAASVIAWRFTTVDARITLKHLYPPIDG
jgi:hypothetical protein